jgi:hypothetical protein
LVIKNNNNSNGGTQRLKEVSNNQIDGERYTGPPIRCIKRKTKGEIPSAVRNSDGHMYIVREYKNGMAGKEIPDEMVVRADNGRWFMKDEVENFLMKCTPCCPTYGVCGHCFGSGPVMLDGRITDAQKGDVRVGLSRRRKMSKEMICGGSL